MGLYAKGGCLCLMQMMEDMSLCKCDFVSKIIFYACGRETRRIKPLCCLYDMLQWHGHDHILCWLDIFITCPELTIYLNSYNIFYKAYYKFLVSHVIKCKYFCLLLSREMKCCKTIYSNSKASFSHYVHRTKILQWDNISTEV